MKTARDAAEQIAQADGAHAAAEYLADVTSALSTAGSSAHAWMLAPAGLAYAGPARDEAWAALTLLALDRKEAADPEHVGLPMDQPRRRAGPDDLVPVTPGGLAQRRAGSVRGRGHLRQAGQRARRGGAGSHGAAVPARRAAALRCRCSRRRRGRPGSVASWRGKSTAGASIARALAALGDLAGARRRRSSRLVSWPAASLVQAGVGNGSTWRAPVTR